VIVDGMTAGAGDDLTQLLDQQIGHYRVDASAGLPAAALNDEGPLWIQARRRGTIGSDATG